MFSTLTVSLKLALSGLLAFAVALLFTPPVKRIAERIGAIDNPDGKRHLHDHPIPRMGGLAIFLGFMMAVLVFGEINTQIMGLLIGAVIIVAMGAVDDVVNLSPWVKLGVQILAALAAVRSGITINVLSNINIFSDQPFFNVGFFSYPLTLLWIVGCTNAVNLIDGLDGLAAGVSAISSVSMLVVALFVAEPTAALLLAALAGACLGFLPYNLNPARIFMGDVGSQFLGFVLATVSAMGMFKFHAIITFLVPVLALSVPLADTVFAFFRRILHGQNPFRADRGHLHYRLLAMGLSQKQTVAVLYAVSASLGLFGVLLAGPHTVVRIVCLALVFAISLSVWLLVFHRHPAPKAEEPPAGPEPEIK